MDSSDKFINSVFRFMETIDYCINNTQYSADRAVYLEDMAIASRWLMQVHRGDPECEIIATILNHETDKHFGDYWRQGPCGDLHAKAYGAFIKSLGPLNKGRSDQK